MKKLFENPVISSVELNSEDVIMASTIAVKKFDKVEGFNDKATEAAGLWEGVSDAWL
ncbi:MAG: hypothetical protein J1F63_03875 [Oscillospiraceae bacterium]|nr:hypothetical protein [Oscillospiraceae bacterium]